MPNAAAQAARFFATADKLIDRTRGCESVRRGPKGTLVLMSDVLGWLNKLDQERQAASDKAAALQQRLDDNAADADSVELYRRETERLKATIAQHEEALTRERAARDEAQKASHAAIDEIASLASAQRELERLRKVHAAFVAGARNLLGDKANELEAQTDVPETFPPGLEVFGFAAPPPKSGTTAQPPEAHAAEQLPPVEDQPVDLVLADRRKTLNEVLEIMQRSWGVFNKLQDGIIYTANDKQLPKRVLFHAAAATISGMARQMMHTIADEIKARIPEAPMVKAAAMRETALAVIAAMAAGARVEQTS